LYPTDRIKIARAAVIKTSSVAVKTTLALFRVRNVIADKAGQQELVAEEKLIWGFRGSKDDGESVSIEEAKRLLNDAVPTSDMSPEQRKSEISNERGPIDSLNTVLDKLAFDRAENLVESHERFRKVMGGNKFKVVLPILPMDLMGLYVLIPDSAKKSRT
jgi:hypothetical protein